MSKFAVLILTTLLLASCGFNRFFYYPDTEKVSTPPDAVSAYIPYGESDSIHSVFYANSSATTSIFILHGNAGNLSSWGEVADLFYQAGYQVFIIDYPGFGNSTGSSKHKTVYEATDAAVSYFNNLPEVKDTKHLLMGFSLGGNLALKVSYDHPEVFDAMLIEAAFESHRKIAIKQVPRPLKFVPFIFAKNEIDGSELITAWKKPLLIVHSEDDAICPYEMGQNLFKNATGTTQKELWTIKGPHLAGLGSNVELYLAKLNKLMNL